MYLCWNMYTNKRKTFGCGPTIKSLYTTVKSAASIPPPKVATLYVS